jgi:hypothetical protein
MIVADNTTIPATSPWTTSAKFVANFPYIPSRFTIENNLIVSKGKKHYIKAYSESGKVILIPIIIEEK